MGVTAFVLVFIFGCIVGAAKLISRHSDYRFHALVTAPSLGYLSLNGFLSISALLAIDYLRPAWLGYEVGNQGEVTHHPDTIRLVLTAGFGAAAFFRSSLFKLKTQDGEIAVGPAIIIDIFLNVIDEAVDRVIGNKRLTDVQSIMMDVDFAKASGSLPTLCFASLKRLSPEVQRQFAVQLKELVEAPNLNEKVRSISLGLTIMNLTGQPILREAVRQLGDDIKHKPP